MQQITDPRDPTGNTSLELVFAHGAFGCSVMDEFPGRPSKQDATLLYLTHYENQTYVIKQLEAELRNFDSTIVRKMPLILELNHGNIARYYGLATVLGPNNGKILARTASKFYPGCTVSTWNEQNINRPLRNERIRGILYELLKGLEYLHSFAADTEIIHCDIKPDNLVLMNYETHVKIIDFETAAVVAQAQLDTKPSGFTRSYAAPEHLLGFCQDYEDVAQISSKSDIWSFGCVALELCTGKAPVICRWNAETGHGAILPLTAILYNVARCSAKPDLRELGAVEPNQLLVRMIESCLSFETDGRQTATQLLQHGYFTSFDQCAREHS